MCFHIQYQYDVLVICYLPHFIILTTILLMRKIRFKEIK